MFYTNCDPHEPVCQYTTSKNREFIEDIDWDVHTARSAALLGTSATQTEHMSVIKDVLSTLPNFKSLCLELGHLDKQHLFAACEPVFALPREHAGTIDERLTAYLTPKRQGQGLPSARAIKKRMKQ